MQYQVQRLAQKLGGATDDGATAGAGENERTALESQWLLIGPLASEDRARLDARFARARKA
jgi:hypothetical protein